MTLGRAITTHAARSIAIGIVPDAALDAFGSGRHALGRARDIARGARWAATGSQALRTMSGRAANPATMVAGEFFHSPGDTQAATAALSTDFAALRADLAHHATSPSDAAWAIADVVPVIAEWDAFAKRMCTSQLAPYLTDWKALENWRNRLIGLRGFARARGITLDSSGPIPLPQTVWERGTMGTGTTIDLAFAMGKWIVYAALGLMGIAGLYAALTTVKREVAAELKAP